MNPLSLYSHLKICPSSFLFENFLVAEASNIDISSNVGDGEGKKWKWGDIERSQKSAPSNCYFCRLLSTSTLTAEEEWCLIWVYFPCVCDFFSWRLLFNSHCPKYVSAAKEQSESLEVNVLSKLCQRRNWCLVKVSPSWLHHQPAYIFHGCELRPLRRRNLECRLLDALPSADPMQCTRSWPLVSVDRNLEEPNLEVSEARAQCVGPRCRMSIGCTKPRLGSNLIPFNPCKVLADTSPNSKAEKRILFDRGHIFLGLFLVDWALSKNAEVIISTAGALVDKAVWGKTKFFLIRTNPQC